MVKKTTVDGDTTYVYDELDRLISTTTPDGKTENIEYDGKGQVTASTDKADTPRSMSMTLPAT